VASTGKPTVGGTINLNGAVSASSPGRGLSYLWTISGETAGHFTSAVNASSATFVADATGTDLNVTLLVTDTAGETHKVSQSFEVSAAPSAQVAVSNLSPQAGANVTLDGSNSSAAAGHSLSSYAWSIVSGGAFAQITSGAQASVAQLSATAAGAVVVRLSVTDDAGTVSSVDSTLTVAAAPIVVTPTPTSSGGGGGGAMGVGWVMCLVAASVLLWRGRPRAVTRPPR